LELPVRRGAVDVAHEFAAMPAEWAAEIHSIEVCADPLMLAKDARVLSRLSLTMAFGDAVTLRVPLSLALAGLVAPCGDPLAGLWAPCGDPLALRAGLRWPADRPLWLRVQSLRPVWPRRKFRVMVVLRGRLGVVPDWVLQPPPAASS
jgi:hypothetical protein